MQSQFLKFLVAGGIATAIQYVVLILLTELSLADPVIASGIGFAASALFNYTLNYHFTFKSEEYHRNAMVKFVAVAAIGLILNTALMYLAVHVIGFNYLVSQVFATICVLLWHFIAHRNWTYRRSPDIAH